MNLFAERKQRHTCGPQTYEERKGKKGGGIGRWGLIHICTLLVLCIKQITEENILYSTRNSTHGLWRPKWKEIQKSGNKCIHIANSLYCTVGTNTTLLTNYTPINIKKTNKQTEKQENYQLPSDPAILLLAIYPSDTRTHIHILIHIHIYIYTFIYTLPLGFVLQCGTESSYKNK